MAYYFDLFFRSARYQNICRLLQMAEMYISSIEENHQSTRTILPHGTSFLGHPILLKIGLESSKEEYLVVVRLKLCSLLFK